MVGAIAAIGLTPASGLCLIACGKRGWARQTGASTSPTASYGSLKPGRDSDGDEDGAASGYYDTDDSRILRFGHEASSADARALTALVRDYYAANARTDGARACRLLYPVLAEAVPEDYGHADGASGHTCAAVVSAMMRRRRRNAESAYATLKLGDVRVEGAHGYVLVGLHGIRPIYYMTVRREGGAWRINALEGRTLP